MKDGSTLLKTMMIWPVIISKFWSYYFEVLETIEKPDFIVRGNKGSLKATRYLLDKGEPKGDVIWRHS